MCVCMQYPAVHFCICSIPTCIIHVCSNQNLVTDNFGLFTEIAVCKFLRGWRSYGPKPFLFCPLYVSIHFSAAFCTVHCALDLARDHAT